MRSEEDMFRKVFHSMHKLKMPDMLVSKTLELIENESSVKEKETIFKILNQKVNRLRVALATAIVLLIIVIPLLFLFGIDKKNANSKPVYVVKFIYKDSNAEKVFIVGDFNGWDKNNIAMKRLEGTGLWVADITLNEGTYRYNFLINDKQWAIDQFSKIKIKDKFGNESSVLVLLPINKRRETL